MGQIEKKKKGRPSKADLSTRPRVSVGSGDENTDRSDVRRSSRRRSFRYNIIDYDEDYLDGDDDDDDFFRTAEVAVREVDDLRGGQSQGQHGGDDVSDDEDERDGEKKKLKLVVKIESNSSGRGKGSRKGSRGGGRVNSVTRPGRVESVSRSGRVTESDDDEDGDDDDEVVRRKVKKRRISTSRDDEDGDGDENDDVDDEEDDDEDERVDGHNGNSKKEAKRGDSVPGTPTGTDRCETPLPDKKLLELILDKLQKKDTYGVYSEPVDREELPDYFDVIDHPMDFSTVRKKLASRSYSILEQFEADVFLISSNAMQYNAPDTVYHKQAYAIKELAERKFKWVRKLQIERLEKEKETETKCEPKLEQKSESRDRPNSIVKKQGKKPFCRSILEPVVSDFSSGATLATAGSNNNCGTDTVGNLERLGNNDGLTDGISLLVDNNAEKAEDPHSGKGILPKFGRRSFLVDENRRATYNASNQPMDTSESLFTPLDDEKKQLIPVGSLGEHSYARSLARFAASLGPNAWGVASKRIEQVLPQGIKFGRGWVGESEPLPTAVIFKGNIEYPFVSRSHEAAKLERNDKQLHYPVPGKAELLKQPSSDGKLVSIFGSRGVKPPTSRASIPQQQKPPSRGSGEPDNKMLKGAEFNHQSTSDQKNMSIFQQQNPPPKALVCPENMGAKRVEPNSPSSYNQKTDNTTQRQPPYGVEMVVNRTRPNSPSKCNQKIDHIVQKQCETGVKNPTAKATEPVPKGKNFLQSLPFKQPETNGGTHTEGLQNGRAINSQNFADSDRLISSPGLIPPHLTGTTASLPQRHDQCVNDPVLVMKMLTEKAQKQQIGSMSVHVQSSSQARLSVPSPRGDRGTHGAATAANTWMPAGVIGFRPGSQNPTSTGSLNPVDPYGAQMFYPQAAQPRAEYPGSGMMHFQPEKKGFPFQAFGSQSVRVGNEPQVPSRPMVFHQTVANDLSRFQVQSPWRGLSSPTQQKQKQETLPPDLNVAFQSVDSQQPDLALQL